MHAYIYIDTYKHIQNIHFFEFFSLLTPCHNRQAAQNDMDTGIPMVGKHAETHRNKVLKRYRSIVDAWYWTSPAGWKWMIFWATSIIGILIWLVVWNMNFIFHSIWECHHPNWRTHSIIFQRGRSTTNQQSLSRKPSRTLHFFVVKNYFTLGDHEKLKKSGEPFRSLGMGAAGTDLRMVRGLMFSQTWTYFLMISHSSPIFKVWLVVSNHGILEIPFHVFVGCHLSFPLTKSIFQDGYIKPPTRGDSSTPLVGMDLDDQGWPWIIGQKFSVKT